MSRALRPLLLTLLILAGCGKVDRLDRVAYLPAAPYDKGPTLSGHTTVRMVDPRNIGQVCLAMNAALPETLRAPPPPRGKQYWECYDPWNDEVLEPDMPNHAESERLYQHGLGHARGGTHDSMDGSGPWRAASWNRFYAHPELAHVVPIPPSIANGVVAPEMH